MAPLGGWCISRSLLTAAAAWGLRWTRPAAICPLLIHHAHLEMVGENAHRLAEGRFAGESLMMALANAFEAVREESRMDHAPPLAPGVSTE